MAAFKRTYGADAGSVIKWALMKGPVTYSDFSQGCKWKTDAWYMELQNHLRKPRLEIGSSTGQRKAVPVQGMTRLGDL